jgi:hypothetical protein
VGSDPFVQAVYRGHKSPGIWQPTRVRHLVNEFVNETRRNGRNGAERSVMISTGAPGIDLTALSSTIMTAEELARAIRSSVGALAQDRFRRQGCPYIRLGRRIRYVRADVARYLAANRNAAA